MRHRKNFFAALLLIVIMAFTSFLAACGEAKTKTYSITVSETANGTVTPNKAEAEAGETITLTVTPNTDYAMDSLKVTCEEGETINVSLVDDGYTFTMPEANVTVDAVFAANSDKEEYTITISDAENGGVTANRSRAKAGEIITLTVKPAEGYSLKTLQYNRVELIAIDGSVSFVMPKENVTVTATFAEDIADKKFTVSIAVCENGEVTADKTQAKAGECVALTITPASGYRLETLKYNNIKIDETDGTYSFTMPAENVTIFAVFSEAVEFVFDDTAKVFTANSAYDQTITDFTIEFDFRIDNANQGFGFGYRNEGKDFLIMQLNTAENDGSIIQLRPHPWVNGNWDFDNIGNFNINDALLGKLGLDNKDDLIGLWAHEKLVVTSDGASTTVKTYFGTMGEKEMGEPIHTWTYDGHVIPLGKLVIRQDTIGNKENASFDNIVVRNAKDEVIYINDFSGGVGFSGGGEDSIVRHDGYVTLGHATEDKGGIYVQDTERLVFAYEKTVEISDTLNSAKIYINSDEAFGIYVDKTLVTADVNSFISSADSKQYYECDLTSLLTAGTHKLAVATVKDGATKAMLVLDGKTALVSDETWQFAATRFYDEMVVAETVVEAVWSEVTDKVSPTANTIVYNGEEQALITAGNVSGGKVLYSLDRTIWSESVPAAVEAGEYTVYYKYVGDDFHSDTAGGTVTVTISKKTLIEEVEYTAPTAVKGLIYSAESPAAQTLANAGNTLAGELQYKLGDGEWGTEIPAATNAGSYTIYWRIVGDKNHNDVAGGSFTTVISNIVYSAPTANALVYTGKAQTLVTAGSAADAAITYSLTENGEYTSVIPTGTDAGQYTVYFKVTDLEGEVVYLIDSLEVNIAKADITVKMVPKAVENLIYTGEAHTLVTAGVAEGGTVVYSLTEDGAYSKSLPTAIAAGEYTVYYKYAGDVNHNDLAGGAVTAVIKELYSITVEKTKNGSVTVETSGKVAAGTQITLQIAPDEGYGLYRLMYNDNDIPLSGGAADGVIFEMPACDVIITTEFVKRIADFTFEGALDTAPAYAAYDFNLADFTIDFDFKIDQINDGLIGWRQGFAFAATDDAHFVMFQLVLQDDGLWIRPHKLNGVDQWDVKHERSVGWDTVASAMGVASMNKSIFHDMLVHERIVVENGRTVKIYLSQFGTEPDTLIYEQDFGGDYGAFTLGKLAVRQHAWDCDSVYYDNILVRDKDGAVRYAENFERGINPFVGSGYAAVQRVTFGGRTSDMLHVGTYDNNDRGEQRCVLELANDNNYTIDFDFRIDSHSQSVGFRYNGGNDTAVFLQVWVDGERVRIRFFDTPWFPKEEADITERLLAAAGLKAGSPLGQWMHERIAVNYDGVANQTTIRVYFAPAGQEPAGEPFYSVSVGDPRPFKNLFIREDTFDQARQCATYDNIVVRGERGTVLYANDFEGMNAPADAGLVNRRDGSGDIDDVAIAEGLGGGKAIRLGDANTAGACNEFVLLPWGGGYSANIAVTADAAVLWVDGVYDVYLNGKLLTGATVFITRDGGEKYSFYDLAGVAGEAGEYELLVLSADGACGTVKFVFSENAAEEARA